ncbi:ABC transporter permease [Pontimicrobium aquaticum]|uniref:ABC transporter permease n=1 Tax=Pontimicrobium aquaticum TaxID=2565367 RepID=A0A4U0ESV7_9FLAO|nr:FtsX-like permease family protein [Pontimicrobium aquaticum]TJY34820.1 ABC transporter permease [Pontimicrobium aquaticum]
MSFPFYIAKRYLFSKSSNNAINFITIIAAIGIIIGSASLFIVLSGFTGLKDFSLQFTSFIDPDLKVVPTQGKSFLLTDNLKEEINSLEGIASYSKVIEERAVLNFKNKNLIVNLKGVDNNYPQATKDSIVVLGQWFEYGTDQIVAGSGVSNNLSFGVFDYDETIKVSVPKPGKGQPSAISSIFKSVNAANSGIFMVNEDIDHSVVYANLETVQYLLNYSPNQISAIELQLKSPKNIDIVKERLQAVIGNSFTIKTRAQLNDALYKMLNTENLAVYLIFTLVLIIALFNVIGSIIMMILDKKNNLNTLYNIGATVKDIRRVFFLQGSLMSILGGSLGLALGYIIIVLQQQFSLVMLTYSLPYPVMIDVKNIFIVFITITILGVLASKLASSRISKKLITEF